MENRVLLALEFAKDMLGQHYPLLVWQYAHALRLPWKTVNCGTELRSLLSQWSYHLDILEASHEEDMQELRGALTD